MSQINVLINSLCPNGVDYKKLGNCCHLEKGQTPIQKAIPGEYPLVVTADERSSSSTYQFDAKAVCIPLISSSGHGKKDLRTLHYQEGKFALGNILCAVIPNSESCLKAKYLFYFLLNKKDTLIVSLMRGGANVALPIDAIKKIKIPVPPLPVQEEIVRILDTFTELTTELTIELTARRKQYEYYRDRLLTIGRKTFPEVRLGEICSVITKGTTPTNYTKSGVSFVKTEAFDGTRIVPEKLSYIDEQTHMTFLKRSILQEDDILLTIAGATIGKCAMVPKEILPANTNQALAIIRLGKGISKKYVMFLLRSRIMKQYMEKSIKGSAQPNLNLKQLNDFVIPLPPLAEQERIASILDCFDTLCNDLTSGLPAEIEARKKQYEYYRDKLLTFQEKRG